MVENQAVRKTFLTYIEAGGVKSEPLYNQELYSLLFNPNVLQEHTLQSERDVVCNVFF